MFCGQLQWSRGFQKGVSVLARRGINIHKRKDGRWEGRYKNGFRADGSTKYSSVYANSYTECKQKLFHKQQDAENPYGNTDNNKRFCDVLDAWMCTNRIRIKGATEAKYAHMIETHISPALGGLKLNQLNAGVINRFLDTKARAGGLQNKKPLSASYVRTMAVIIEAALRYASLEGWCTPLRSPIHKPVVVKNKIAVLDKHTLAVLTEHITNDLSPTAIGILLALYGGLRIGEVCALQWRDIDFSSNLIHIRHTVARVPSPHPKQKTQMILDTPKTASSLRDVPMPSFLRQILWVASQNPHSSFVVSASDTFVSTRTMDYQYRRWLTQHRLPLFRFHTLRHTYATYCAESGMDAKTLSQLLGHSSSTTSLNIYVHPSLDVAATVLERIYCSS